MGQIFSKCQIYCLVKREDKQTKVKKKQGLRKSVQGKLLWVVWTTRIQ